MHVKHPNKYILLSIYIRETLFTDPVPPSVSFGHFPMYIVNSHNEPCPDLPVKGICD